VKRLGPGRIDVTSQLDAGTEISVTLPLDFVYKQPANSFPFNFNSQNTSRPTSSRRIISDELNKLLGPPSQMLPSEATTPPPVPPSPSTSFTPSFSSPNKRNLRPPQVDFPHAVAAVQASLASPVQAPETGPTLPSFGQDDLAIEAAKLAIATTQEVDSSLIPMSSPLPVTAIDEEQAQLNARKEEEARAANARQKKVEEQRKKSVAPDVHVLFADDNPVARNILVKLFTGKVSFTLFLPFSSSRFTKHSPLFRRVSNSLLLKTVNKPSTCSKLEMVGSQSCFWTFKCRSRFVTPLLLPLFLSTHIVRRTSVSRTGSKLLTIYECWRLSKVGVDRVSSLSLVFRTKLTWRKLWEKVESTSGS